MNYFKKIKALFKSLRPELSIIAGICVIMGEIIALETSPTLSQIVLGFAFGFLLSGSTMLLNDYYDIEVDRINSPERPLPSGLVSSKEVIVFAIITSLTGLIISLTINGMISLMYIILWSIGFFYNYKGKEMGLFGNLLVSFSVSLTVILGGVVVNKVQNINLFIFCIMLFIFNLAEEIAADTMDIEGDKSRSSKSIAISIGKKKALNISFMLFLSYILLSTLYVFFGLFDIAYLVIIFVSNCFVLFWGIKLIRNKNLVNTKIYIRRLYLSAFVGILIIVVSRLFRFY